MIRPFYHVATSGHTSELRKHVLQRTSIRRQSLIAHTTAQKTSEEAPSGSLKKVKDSSDEEPSPLRLDHASKEARRILTRKTI